MVQEFSVPAVINKKLVPAHQRTGFFPRHFPVAYMKVELQIYGHLSALADGYRGGGWAFVELDNGGCFIAPHGVDQVRLCNADNGSDETITGEAAGVVACLYAFSHLSFGPGLGYLGDKFHLLRDFALEHPEAAKIFALID